MTVNTPKTNHKIKFPRSYKGKWPSPAQDGCLVFFWDSGYKIRGLTNFALKGQTVNHLDFVGHLVSVTTNQLCKWSGKAATDIMQPVSVLHTASVAVFQWNPIHKKMLWVDLAQRAGSYRLLDEMNHISVLSLWLLDVEKIVLEATTSYGALVRYWELS